MTIFRKTSHLSEILQESEKGPVMIYKHSLTCGTSTETYNTIEKSIIEKTIDYPVYIVVVQEMPVLSRNIETLLEIKHESPQVIILEKGKVKTHKSHREIYMLV